MAKHESDELTELREKVRWLVALVFSAGVLLDRLGPVVFGPAYEPWSEVALASILGSILILLGSEGLTWLLKR